MHGPLNVSRFASGRLNGLRRSAKLYGIGLTDTARFTLECPTQIGPELFALYSEGQESAKSWDRIPPTHASLLHTVVLRKENDHTNTRARTYMPTRTHTRAHKHTCTNNHTYRRLRKQFTFRCVSATGVSTLPPSVNVES